MTSDGFHSVWNLPVFKDLLNRYVREEEMEGFIRTRSFIRIQIVEYVLYPECFQDDLEPPSPANKFS